MTTITIALLAALSLFLGMRLFAASTENSALRTHVAALKRQLQRR
jgi:hypothetical protein